MEQGAPVAHSSALGLMHSGSLSQLLLASHRHALHRHGHQRAVQSKEWPGPSLELQLYMSLREPGRAKPGPVAHSGAAGWHPTPRYSPMSQSLIGEQPQGATEECLCQLRSSAFLLTVRMIKVWCYLPKVPGHVSYVQHCHSHVHKQTQSCQPPARPAPGSWTTGSFAADFRFF